MKNRIMTGLLLSMLVTHAYAMEDGNGSNNNNNNNVNKRARTSDHQFVNSQAQNNNNNNNSSQILTAELIPLLTGKAGKEEEEDNNETGNNNIEQHEKIGRVPSLAALALIASIKCPFERLGESVPVSAYAMRDVLLKALSFPWTEEQWVLWTFYVSRKEYIEREQNHIQSFKGLYKNSANDDQLLHRIQGNKPSPDGRSKFTSDIDKILVSGTEEEKKALFSKKEQWSLPDKMSLFKALTTDMCVVEALLKTLHDNDDNDRALVAEKMLLKSAFCINGTNRVYCNRQMFKNIVEYIKHEDSIQEALFSIINFDPSNKKDVETVLDHAKQTAPNINVTQIVNRVLNAIIRDFRRKQIVTTKELEQFEKGIVDRLDHLDMLIGKYTIDLNIMNYSSFNDHIFNNPLFRAIEAGYIKMVEWLIAHGAKVNVCIVSQGYTTPLLRAIAGTSLLMVKLLVDNGAIIVGPNPSSDQKNWATNNSFKDTKEINHLAWARQYAEKEPENQQRKAIVEFLEQRMKSGR